MRFLRLLLLLLPALVLSHLPAAEVPAPRVLVIGLDDTIQPVSADYVLRGLRLAAEQHAQAVLIRLDTPGGLLTSTRRIVGAILDSPVPVIVYVAPTGARAASAGFFLLLSADVAAMAPGTNTGAAHPVPAQGGSVSDTMREKMENDAVAFLSSYSAARGRPAKAGEDAVRRSLSYSAAQALDLHLADLVAADEAELLQRLDGRTITRFHGEKQTLRLGGARLVPVEPTVRERVLGVFVNPDLALMALVAGALLIYLEFNTPGTVVPGALGTLLVLLALFSLNLLPIRYSSVFLLAAGLLLLLAEAKFPSHGILSVAGIAALAVGALTLVAAPIPEMRIHAPFALALAAAFGLITVLLVRAAVRARRNKSRTGVEALVGAIGRAMQPLAPEGAILVEGEIWQASSPLPIAEGEKVRVYGTRGMELLVERVPGPGTGPG
jgi:membrane-bound serine protease (ClpP class)